jgi:hypothetical protein
MADFLRRQAEKKLSHFWAPVYGAWFSKYPEQAELDLPLPDKPDARQLTPEENKKLGDAITERKKVRMFLMLFVVPTDGSLPSKLQAGFVTKRPKLAAPTPAPIALSPSSWTRSYTRSYSRSPTNPGARASRSKSSSDATAP